VAHRGRRPPPRPSLHSTHKTATPGKGESLRKLFPPADANYRTYGKPISGPVYLFSFDLSRSDWTGRYVVVPRDFASARPGVKFPGTFVTEGGDQHTVFSDLSCELLAAPR
jgi:hypothetical protein